MKTGAMQGIAQGSQQITASALRPGQVLTGVITKLFPDQLAEVQIGSQKMIAQLEAPLSANQQYWFQVQPGEGKVHLKVIAADGNNARQAGGLNKVLGEFSLPVTKENMEILRFFIKEHLPVSREILQQVSEWLKADNPGSQGLEAVKMMVSRGLPMTQATYSALVAVNGEQSTASLMNQLQAALGSVPESETGRKIFSLLENLIPNDKGAAAQEADPAIFSSSKLKEFMSALGLSYEKQLSQAFSGLTKDVQLQTDTMKPQLMQLLAEQPEPTVREAAEKLLNKITGFQVLSQESGPMQQLIVQFPILMGSAMNEVTMQWSGQKKEDGSIDADFCRVLFYLKLAHISDTIVDLQVQNRIMSIQVINGHPLLKKMADNLVPLLKENLARIDYHLTSINFAAQKPVSDGKEQKKLAELSSKKEYNRVDFKI